MELQLINTLFDFVRDEGEKAALDLASLLVLLDDMSAQGISLPCKTLVWIR
jgi:hypothetical protein